MKRCPKCETVYTDASLSFCLSDGTPLTDDIRGAETEVLPNMVVNIGEDTAEQKTVTRDSRPAETEEMVVSSTRGESRKGVSPIWILSTFALLGIVLGVVIIGIVILQRNPAGGTSESNLTNKNSVTKTESINVNETSSNAEPENISAETSTRTPTPTPTPTATKTPASSSYRVVGVKSNDVLYIRPAAGNLKVVVGKIPPNGTGIRIVGGGKKVGKSIWVPIVYNGKRGWVNRRYLSREKVPE